MKRPLNYTQQEDKNSSLIQTGILDFHVIGKRKLLDNKMISITHVTFSKILRVSGIFFVLQKQTLPKFICKCPLLKINKSWRNLSERCFESKSLFQCADVTSIGESLFTLFASLTYAYHYLMTLIKKNLNIERV